MSGHLGVVFEKVVEADVTFESRSESEPFVAVLAHEFDVFRAPRRDHVHGAIGTGLTDVLHEQVGVWFACASVGMVAQGRFAVAMRTRH